MNNKQTMFFVLWNFAFERQNLFRCEGDRTLVCLFQIATARIFQWMKNTIGFVIQSVAAGVSAFRPASRRIGQPDGRNAMIHGPAWFSGQRIGPVGSLKLMQK
ncbi:hypothetical protein [Caballeronia sp. NK8]|uniref:hypothetical protein n=1 Tax=Caballeronia sp. NK8 TaxID=140098 RepID=UPI001BCEFA34|nr:hypothetical protein [Caballeronia sp. NK8]